MAEVEGVDVKSDTDMNKNGSESPPSVSHSPQHVPSTALNNNTASSQQLSTSNSVMSGNSSGMTSEQRRKLIAEAEQQRTEQRRQQILEAQRRAEEQREKQREERKRRIEENKKREEERQRKALETKKEIERQYKDHMMMLAQRGSSASKNSDHMPAIMRNSHMSTRSHTAGPTSINGGIGDRMATSFTVAFGSSAPRSICTKANEAVLRSQAAFEARLASYLNGRHSGCFLTQSSTYTTYALYVKPDLLPENHPIRRHLHEGHHSLSTPRRAASANPTLRAAAAKKPTQSSGVGERGRRSESVARQPPQAQHRSRPTVRLPPPDNTDGVAAANLPQPIRRAASSQHFAEPTIAFSSKVKGAPPPEITRKLSGDGMLPKRRTVPGRSTIPRDRCNSYAAPTTAWTIRQRANSQDRKPSAPSATESDTRMATSVILPRQKPVMTASKTKPMGGEGDETRGRSTLREQLKQNTAIAQPPQWNAQPTTLGPSLTKTAPLKAIPAKKNFTNKPSNEPIKTNMSEDPFVIKRKPKPPEADSISEAPKSVMKPIPTHPTQTTQRPPKNLTPEHQKIQAEPPIQPTSPPRPSNLATELQELQTPAPPPSNLAADLDLARPHASSPPPPPETPPPEPFSEDAVEVIQQQQKEEEEEEPVQEPPAAFADHEEVLETEAKETDGEILTKEKQQLIDVPDHEQLEETPLSESKPEVVEIQNGHQEVQKNDPQELTLHMADSLENVQSKVNHEPSPQSVQPSTKPQELEERTTAAKLPAELLSKPLVASTTGSGEGGSLTEEEAAIYRAKMAEQRRLAKERLAEQQRLEAEAEKERKAKREAERQAAIEAARERAIEEARLAAEARMAKEAAEEQARLEAERKAQERVDKDRQAGLDWSKAMVDLTESDLDRMEAMMRERSERIRKSEEEREMRRKRLESIMSRVNRSDRSLSRGVPNSSSANSLTGSVTGAGGNGIDENNTKSGATVHFSLGPNNLESSNGILHSVTSNGEGDGPALRGQQQNGFSEAAPRATTFNSPLLTSLFSGGGLGGINSQRLSTSMTGTTVTNPSSDSALSSQNNNMHSDEPQQPHSPASNLAMGTVGNASNS